jgi:hypothetical protein
MNDPGRMRRRESVGDLHCVFQRVRKGQSSTGNQAVECLPRHILHRDEVGAIVARDIVKVMIFG